ncbi:MULTISPECIES: helix-turn-helix domain-containing protein [Providencia]|uniref:helix-turn-helix domain-containing protein n=1 Tax=Providencia TaxID=586 RepID=UPI001C5A65AA|nr:MULTISPECIES: helix-turn-helix transcriptional regulator [Providencia]ELR5150616.1 helix-turn-helix transcriptional regulator [Providencia rettgeri]ELR5153290.1 helix-turn-helix transcriptional regulator [Providencia rettgeri]QXX82242.1 helix-turn-helix transcriptional regulator [Providencia sp. R33]
MPECYPISRIIGNKITYYRKMKGMSLHELAKIIGVSEQQQSRYERGVNRINLDRLNQYATFFETELIHFFNFSNEEKMKITETYSLMYK